MQQESRKLLESGLIEKYFGFFIIIVAGLLHWLAFDEILFLILNGKGFQRETENHYKIILSKIGGSDVYNWAFAKK